MNIPPKEHAKNLILHFKVIVYPFIGSSYLTGDESNEVMIMNAKECAKSSVILVINALSNFSAHIKHISELEEKTFNYWEEVLLEIENYKEDEWENKTKPISSK